MSTSNHPSPPPAGVVTIEGAGTAPGAAAAVGSAQLTRQRIGSARLAVGPDLLAPSLSVVFERWKLVLVRLDDQPPQPPDDAITTIADTNLAPPGASSTAPSAAASEDPTTAATASAAPRADIAVASTVAEAAAASASHETAAAVPIATADPPVTPMPPLEPPLIFFTPAVHDLASIGLLAQHFKPHRDSAAAVADLALSDPAPDPRVWFMLPSSAVLEPTRLSEPIEAIGHVPGIHARTPPVPITLSGMSLALWATLEADLRAVQSQSLAGRLLAGITNATASSSLSSSFLPSRRRRTSTTSLEPPPQPTTSLLGLAAFAPIHIVPPWSLRP
ncbi:hypothetical protein HK405_013366, partial [Cladochytrium tenue]